MSDYRKYGEIRCCEHSMILMTGWWAWLCVRCPSVVVLCPLEKR